MQQTIEFTGEVVEEQAFLDGTREFTIEAEEVGAAGDAAWHLSLTFRWPKETEIGLEEGELSATRGGDALYATLGEGTAETVFDEDAADEVVRFSLTFEASSGEAAFAGVTGTAHLSGEIAGTQARLTARFELQPPS